MSSIDFAKGLFSKVNDFLVYRGQQPMFVVVLVGARRVIKLSGSTITIETDKLLEEATDNHLIILPQVCGDFPAIVDKNKDLAVWLSGQYEWGAEIASLCVGVFLLASSGLLNGRKCATHWAAVNDLKVMFPDVVIVDNKIITDQDGIYTSGGNVSYLNLIIYLIEKFCGHEMAVFVSKMFEIEYDRTTQAPFSIFMGQKRHDDEVVKKAQAYIEENYRNKITLEELMEALCVSRRNLERRFKKATSNTVVEYIQRVKIEAVKKGLEAGGKAIVELMHEVDYTDIKAFRRLFKKFTGITPVEYRNRYGLQESVMR